MNINLKKRLDNISIPGLCFLLIDCSSFGEGGLFEIGCPRARGWKNVGHILQGGCEVLKIGQFSWSSYVYHP